MAAGRIPANLARGCLGRRFKAIGQPAAARALRRVAGDLAERLDDAHEAVEREGEDVEDDRLRLIFTAAIPPPPPAQVALTLREVCGLTTETRTPSSARRRRWPSESCARRGRSGTRASYQVLARYTCRTGSTGAPRSTSSSTRDTVLRHPLTRHDLSGEAIRLGLDRAPPEPEAAPLR